MVVSAVKMPVMPAPAITIAQPNPDGSLPVPAGVSDAPAESSPQALRARADALQEQIDALKRLLDKPLNDILGDRETALDSAAAWDQFGAMWMLSQRAMRRVALDLAAAQGVSEADVVAQAMGYANAVLNTEDEDLGGTVAPAQLAHIGRHKAFLRKQFR